MSKELIRELRYVAEWAQHHLDKSKIVNDAADALEAQAAKIAELHNAWRGCLLMSAAIAEERDTLRAELQALREQEPVAWLVNSPHWYAPLVQLNKPTALGEQETVQPLYLAAKPTVRELSDSEICTIARETDSAEPGRDGYILPITFARAVLKAVRGEK